MAQRPVRWFNPRDRRPHAPSVPQESWEQHRSRLRDMYLEQGMKLEEIMKVMREQYSFAPSKRQYTSQFYSKWGFYKRAGRDQERANNIATSASIAESGSTECPQPSPAIQLASSGNGVTQAEIDPLASVPGVHSAYPGFSRSLDTEFPQAVSARQSAINPSSCTEGASPSSEALAEEVERRQGETLLNPPSDIASASVIEVTNGDIHGWSSKLDSTSAPFRIDGRHSDEASSSDDFGKDVTKNMKPHPPSTTKASSLSASADNKTADVVDATESAPQDVCQWSWNVAMHSYDTNCNDGPQETDPQDQAFPTLCTPSEQTIDQFSTLSQTLLGSPGSSLSGLSSMMSLRNRISRNGASPAEWSPHRLSCSSGHSVSTISSSLIGNHIFQNGRRYHAFGSTTYWGPDDEEAQDVQDISHHLWALCLEGQLCFAQVKNPKAILDLGTGTGMWVLDIADKYPKAGVEGWDISPIQPAWVPLNSRFLLEDFNGEWLGTHKYDFIHARELLGSVPDWMEMYRKVYEALKPGGWFDQAEPSIIFRAECCTLDEAHPYSVWNNVMIEAGTRAGMEFEVGPQIEDRLKEVGFVNLQVVRKTWPIGPWATEEGLKEIGSFNSTRLFMGIHGLCSRRLMDEKGWSPAAIDDLCRRLKKAFRTPKLHSCHWVYYACGQKPEVVKAEDMKLNETYPNRVSSPVKPWEKTSKPEVPSMVSKSPAPKAVI